MYGKLAETKMRQTAKYDISTHRQTTHFNHAEGNDGVTYFCSPQVAQCHTTGRSDLLGLPAHDIGVALLLGRSLFAVDLRQIPSHVGYFLGSHQVIWDLP